MTKPLIHIALLASLAVTGYCQSYTGPLARFLAAVSNNEPVRITGDLRLEIARGAVAREIDSVRNALTSKNDRLKLEASALVRIAAETDLASAANLSSIIPVLLELTHSTDPNIKSNSLAALAMLNPSPPAMLANQFERMLASTDPAVKTVGLCGLLRLKEWNERQRMSIKKFASQGSRDSLLVLRHVASENALQKRSRPEFNSMVVELLPSATPPNGLVLAEIVAIVATADSGILPAVRNLLEQGRVSGETQSRLRKLFANGLHLDPR